MSYLYVNPGFANMCSSNVVPVQHTDPTYSNTGYAFAQNTQASSLPIPGYSSSDTDFWCKLDFYMLKSTTNNLYLGAPDTTSRSNITGMRIAPSSASVTIYIYYKKQGSTSYYNASWSSIPWAKFNRPGLNTLLLHVKYGGEGVGDITVTINGDVYKLSDKVTSGLSVDHWTGTSGCAWLESVWDQEILFSNIIVSNQEINWNTTIAKLPTTETTTTMTDNGDGSYSSDAANQQILQTVDASTLIKNYGGTSDVYGLITAACPAYTTGSGITSLIPLKGTTAYTSQTLTTDTTNSVMYFEQMSNTTLSSLPNDLKLGWKTGA